MVACAPSTLVLLNTGSERVQQVHGSKGGAESWAFSLSSLVGAFCLLLGRLLRGYSTKAWLGRQTSQLCTKQTLLVCSSNPVYITNTFGVFGVSFFFLFLFLLFLFLAVQKCEKYPQVVTAWVGPLLSRPECELDVALWLLGFLFIALFFCV